MLTCHGVTEGEAGAKGKTLLLLSRLTKENVHKNTLNMQHSVLRVVVVDSPPPLTPPDRLGRPYSGAVFHYSNGAA